MKYFQNIPSFVFFVLSGFIVGCGGTGGPAGGGAGGGGGANPAPTISLIAPTSAPQAGQTFALTVSGSGFVSGSRVNWGPTSLITAYVSASTLTAQVPSSDLATQGSYAVTVTSPAPGGGTSSAFSFTV